MRRLLVRVTTAAVAVASALAMLAAPASADTPRVFQNQGTGKCLHHNGIGTVTTVAACSLTNGALHWHIHDAPETGYDDRRFVSSNGGLCLTAWNDGSVDARPCEENLANQLWLFGGSVANGYLMRNLAGTLVPNFPDCLGSPSNSSGRINLVECGDDDTNPFRRWKPLS